MKSLYLLPLLMLMAGCAQAPVPKPDLTAQLTLLGKRIDCLKAERDEYLADEGLAIDGWSAAANSRDTRALAAALDKRRNAFKIQDDRCYADTDGAK